MDAVLPLELQNISLEVDNQPYLENINLSFNSGAFNVLLGRTLAGKTSLMRVIAGLDKPTAGKVVLNGQDITELPVQKRNLSMVYQQFINYPHLTVWENIASPLKIAKVKPQEITRRVNEIAELLHIGPFLQRLPLELSGGQQQRCAMARALVKDAQIILFDEPLVNLDYKLRETLRLELKSLFKQRDSIALYASTEAHEALALGGTTCLLHQGRVLQHGAALQQFYQPVNLDAADLYHEPPLNRFMMMVENQNLDLGAGINVSKIAQFRTVSDGAYQCAFRPDKISLSSTGQDEIEFDAKVDIAEISASETYLHISLTSSTFQGVSWVAHLKGIHSLHYDTPIKLFVALADLYVFDQAGKSISWPESAQLHANLEAC